MSISDAVLDDQGPYTCTVEDHSGNKKSKSEFVRILEADEPFLRLIPDAIDVEREIGTKRAKANERKGQDDDLRWVVQIESNPKPISVVW